MLLSTSSPLLHFTGVPPLALLVAMLVSRMFSDCKPATSTKGTRLRTHAPFLLRLQTTAYTIEHSRLPTRCFLFQNLSTTSSFPPRVCLLTVRSQSTGCSTATKGCWVRTPTSHSHPYASVLPIKQRKWQLHIKHTLIHYNVDFPKSAEKR
jgi:hypothetical protein